MEVGGELVLSILLAQVETRHEHGSRHQFVPPELRPVSMYAMRLERMAREKVGMRI